MHMNKTVKIEIFVCLGTRRMYESRVPFFHAEYVNNFRLVLE